MKQKIHNLAKSPYFLVTAIFFIALGVRFLTAQDQRFEAPKVQATVVEFYRMKARFIVEDGVFSLFDPAARVADLELMAHPPGYSLLLALLFALFGESTGVIQTVSVIFDAASAVLIFLIARRLFSTGTAFAAGMLAALSPQFAVNSVMFLPDTLAIFPLLTAVYFFVRAFQDVRLRWVILCGVFLGLSCWLRANALLIPLFFAAAGLLLFDKKQKIYFSFVLCAGFALTVAPITIRNAIVYREFIPISLGAGQTMLEGIGDYDADNRFGIPRTDYGIIKQEAERENRPDYAVTLFGKDGVQRDRARLARGFQFVKEHPFWFAKVMFLRAMSMTKLERVTPVAPAVPVTNDLPDTGEIEPVWKKSGGELAESGRLTANDARLSEAGATVILQTDNTKYGMQFESEPIDVKPGVEYYGEVFLKLRKGRVAFKATGAKSGKVYAFEIINFEEWENSAAPPLKIARLPLTAGADEHIKISVFNEAPETPGSLVEIEQLRLFEMGESAYLWTKPLRFVIGSVQKLFITAVMLPLAICGLIILLRQKKYAETAILMIVPVYYFCVQSALHTEYRYVMAIHYSFFVLAAIFLTTSLKWLTGKFRQLIERRAQTVLS